MKPKITFRGALWITPKIEKEITEAFDDFFDNWGPISYFVDEMIRYSAGERSRRDDNRLNAGALGLGYAFLRHVKWNVMEPWKFLLRRDDFDVEIDWSPA